MHADSINDNRTKDGRIITCHWFNTPLKDLEGKFAGVISLAQDITQMVVFRLLQGVCGAALVPLSQAVMLDSYALHESARARSPLFDDEVDAARAYDAMAVVVFGEFARLNFPQE